MLHESKLIISYKNVNFIIDSALEHDYYPWYANCAICKKGNYINKQFRNINFNLFSFFVSISEIELHAINYQEQSQTERIFR